LRIDLDHGKVGKRPDLIFVYDGMTWAIECKTPLSNKVKAYKDKVLEASKQIEEVSVTVDRGFAVLNMRNAIDHDSFWPLLPSSEKDNKILVAATYIHEEAAYFRLVSFRPPNNDIKDDFGGENAKAILAKWKRTRPFILNFYSSTAYVLEKGKQRLGLFRTFEPTRFEPLDSRDEKLLNMLQEAMHDRL
jgi:hypothetical protein